MFTAPEKAAMAHKVWVSLQKKEVSIMFRDFHSLFHSLLITYNIATSYEEENSTQTQERHGKVDAVLVLIVLDQFWTFLHIVRMFFLHLGLDRIHQSSNQRCGSSLSKSVGHHQVDRLC